MPLELSGIRRFFSLHSYRGRYLLLVLLFSIVLIGAAYVGQSLVRESSERNTRQTTQSASLLSALNDASRQLNLLKSDLLNFSITPDKANQDSVIQSERAMLASLQRLRRLARDFESSSMQELEQVLFRDGESLSVLVSELQVIRLSNERWFPASRLMAEKLVPLNNKLRGNLQNLDQMLSEDRGNELLRLELRQLQGYWLSLVGELRLMVSNRFGVFDTNSKNAMLSRADNIRQFSAQARNKFSELNQKLMEKGDELLLDEYLKTQDAFNAWMAGTEELRSLLADKDWRRDTLYLRESINPLMATMHQRIDAMSLQLQTEMQKLLNAAQDNSATMARAIAIATAAILALFLIGYLAFEFWLLRPIEHISRLLKLEAQGQAMHQQLHAPVTETQALVEAFDEMHRQVRARQKHLDHMAHHDALTGLPNRLLFREKLDASLKQLGGNQQIALLFLDLDRFKNINDSHGHLVGDRLLVQVARRLRSVFRTQDTVARLSGDEFAVLLDSFHDNDELERLAEKVIQTFGPPFLIEGNTYHSSASIGMTTARAGECNADELIQQADAAMYHAKAGGRGDYRHFDQEMVEQSTALLALETDLYSSIEKDQLEIFLQPIVDLSNHAMHANECLLRWRHPQRGLLTPDDFLGTLVDIGMLQKITELTLDMLADQGLTRNQALSINVPAQLLVNTPFVEGLLLRFENGELEPRHLIIEITEDSISSDLSEAAPLMQILQASGVRFALDDFGTGRSSLSQLRSVKFDILKIDRSFVHDLTIDNQAANVVGAIIKLAHSMGIEVVGEGVETEAQRKSLVQHGCQYGQGFLFGPPVMMGEHMAEKPM